MSINKNWPKTREQLAAIGYQLDDFPQPKPCRACGEPLVWALTPKGSRMPLAPGFVDGVESFDIHFAACPGAAGFRRKGGAALAILLLACVSAARGQSTIPADTDFGTIVHFEFCDGENCRGTVQFNCDKIQPPNDGAWDAYGKVVKACRGELMAEYVMRAARSHWGDWCNTCESREGDTSGVVFCTALGCSGLPPQDRIDARAQEYLDADKALLKRLLKLLTVGEESK